LRYQIASEIRADLKRLKREIESGKSASISAAVPLNPAPSPLNTPSAISSQVATPTPASSGSIPPAPTSPVTSARTSRWPLWSALAVLAVVIVGAGLWLRTPVAPPRISGSKQLTNDGLPKFSLVADESRIYFSELTPSGVVLAQVATGGGEIAHIET